VLNDLDLRGRREQGRVPGADWQRRSSDDPGGSGPGGPSGPTSAPDCPGCGDTRGRRRKGGRGGSGGGTGGLGAVSVAVASAVAAAAGAEGVGAANLMAEETLVELLRQRPKDVPVLRTRAEFQRFFHGKGHTPFYSAPRSCAPPHT